LHNKFLASLPGVVLNCDFKVFPFILVISVYDNLKKKKKKKKKNYNKVWSFLQNFEFGIANERTSHIRSSAVLPNSSTEAAIHCYRIFLSM
jgi:hypothetical protein